MFTRGQLDGVFAGIYFPPFSFLFFIIFSPVILEANVSPFLLRCHGCLARECEPQMDGTRKKMAKLVYSRDTFHKSDVSAATVFWHNHWRIYACYAEEWRERRGGGGERKEEWIGTDSTEAGKQASKQAIECCQHSVTRRPKVWSWEAPPAVYPMPLF